MATRTRTNTIEIEEHSFTAIPLEPPQYTIEIIEKQAEINNATYIPGTIPNESKKQALINTRIFDEYILGTAEGLRKWCVDHGIVYVLISSLFRGIGQVVFMDNCWTGLIIFIGLMYFNYYYALLGLIGGCTNYATAIILLGTKYLSLPTPNYLNNGIFVYNGVLLGLMCGTFVDGLSALLFIKLIPLCMIFSYICAIIHVAMTNVYPTFPVFAFPFCFSGFFYLAVSLQVTWINSTCQPYLAIDNAIDNANKMSINNAYTVQDISYQDVLFRSIFRGPAQVFLCSDEYIGILCLIAIGICNWKASLLALCGSIIGSLVAVLISVDLDRIYFGLHSYNSTLTMMAVGCIFATFNVNNFIMAIFHSMVSVLIELALITLMAPFGLPYLGLPFCLSTMFFAVFAYRKKQQVLRRNRENSNMKRAPVKLDDTLNSVNTNDNIATLTRAVSSRGAHIQLDIERTV